MLAQPAPVPEQSRRATDWGKVFDFMDEHDRAEFDRKMRQTSDHEGRLIRVESAIGASADARERMEKLIEKNREQTESIWAEDQRAHAAIMAKLDLAEKSRVDAAVALAKDLAIESATVRSEFAPKPFPRGIWVAILGLFLTTVIAVGGAIWIVAKIEVQFERQLRAHEMRPHRAPMGERVRRNGSGKK